MRAPWLCAMCCPLRISGPTVERRREENTPGSDALSGHQIRMHMRKQSSPVNVKNPSFTFSAHARHNSELYWCAAEGSASVCARHGYAQIPFDASSAAYRGVVRHSNLVTLAPHLERLRKYNNWSICGSVSAVNNAHYKSRSALCDRCN
ncbi:hypothetical protein AcW1_006821 [Taiwanofungus camphoratus]|nr:hypothetical protein AcW1_006821 [Antrodia cinnamomea]